MVIRLLTFVDTLLGGVFMVTRLLTFVDAFLGCLRILELIPEHLVS